METWWYPLDSPAFIMEALHWVPQGIIEYVDAYSATLKTDTINHYHCSIPSSWHSDISEYYASEFDGLLRTLASA